MAAWGSTLAADADTTARRVLDSGHDSIVRGNLPLDVSTGSDHRLGPTVDEYGLTIELSGTNILAQ